ARGVAGALVAARPGRLRRRRHVEPFRGAPACRHATGLALRHAPLRARGAPRGGRHAAGGARGAPRLLDGGHVRRARPGRGELRVLGHHGGTRTDPSHPGASPFPRPRAARDRALRALLDRAPARSSHASRTLRGRRDGPLRRVRHELPRTHGSRAVSQRVAPRMEAPGRRRHVPVGPPHAAASGAPRRRRRVDRGAHDPLRARPGGIRRVPDPGGGRGAAAGGRQLLRALGPDAAGAPGHGGGLVGHRLALHALHAGRLVATRRPPRVRIALVSAAALPGGEPEAAVRLLRHRGLPASPQHPLPRGHDRGAAALPARPVRQRRRALTPHVARAALVCWPTTASSWRPRVSGTRSTNGASPSGTSPSSATTAAWPARRSDSAPTSARPSIAPTTPAFVTQARAVARSVVGKFSVLSALSAIVIPDSKNTMAANAGNRYWVR